MTKSFWVSRLAYKRWVRKNLALDIGIKIAVIAIHLLWIQSRPVSTGIATLSHQAEIDRRFGMRRAEIEDLAWKQLAFIWLQDRFHLGNGVSDPFLLQLCDDIGERFYVIQDRAGTALARGLTHNAHRANTGALLNHAGADIKCDVAEPVFRPRQ